MARSRSTANALARLLHGSLVPVLVFDGQRSVVFCNESLAQLAGCETRDLIGLRGDYGGRSDEPPQACVHALCPPPQVFRGHRQTMAASWQPAAFEPRHYDVEFIPLGAESAALADGDTSSVLALLHPAAGSEVTPDPLEMTAEQLHQRLWKVRRFESSWPPSLIGDSPAVRRLREQVELLSTQNSHAVIVGPPGSGRQSVARYIHYQSAAGSDRAPSAAGPLVPLACALMDAEILQTTITAFVRQTNHADSDKPSALLLLDADLLVPSAQAELAGFLTLPEFTLFTLATARQSLVELAQQQEFRSDLAFALSTVELQLPALASRREDIPLVSQFLVEQINARSGAQLAGFSEAAMDRLVAYDWPENVAELSEVVGQACQQADGPWIDVEDLPELLDLAARAAARRRPAAQKIDLDAFLRDIESELLRRAMQAAKGNKTKAAERLGISRARFHRRWDQLGLA